MENKELFNNKTKEQPAQRQPMQLGLYDATNEHDACGVGMLVNIHGSKSHELVESALKVLENMRHRGAEGADNKTGDGAGIMLQIPHEFIPSRRLQDIRPRFRLRHPYRHVPNRDNGQTKITKNGYARPYRTVKPFPVHSGSLPCAGFRRPPNVRS